MVAHDLDTLFALSSRIGVIADKHFIAIDTPERVLRKSTTLSVKPILRGERGGAPWRPAPTFREHSHFASRRNAWKVNRML